jgi:hypothetical protein
MTSIHTILAMDTTTISLIDVTDMIDIVGEDILADIGE